MKKWSAYELFSGKEKFELHVYTESTHSANHFASEKSKIELYSLSKVGWKQTQT